MGLLPALLYVNKFFPLAGKVCSCVCFYRPDRQLDARTWDDPRNSLQGKQGESPKESLVEPVQREIGRLLPAEYLVKQGTVSLVLEPCACWHITSLSLSTGCYQVGACCSAEQGRVKRPSVEAEHAKRCSCSGRRSVCEAVCKQPLSPCCQLPALCAPRSYHPLSYPPLEPPDMPAERSNLLRLCGAAAGRGAGRRAPAAQTRGVR